MKTKLLAGAALAVVLGLSSAAYANPKNSFSDDNTTDITSTAANIQIGNISAANGNTSGTGGSNSANSGSDNDQDANGVGVGLGNGDTHQGDSTNVGLANSESFNVSADGVSSQTLVGLSILNIQANVANQDNSSSAGADGDDNEDNDANDNAAVAVLVNGGASASIGNNNGGISTASAASGVGAMNNVGISVGAAAHVGF